MSRRNVCWVAALSTLAGMLAPAASHAQRPGPRLLQSISVPANATGATAVPFSHVLQEDEPYRLVVEGVVDLWPSNGTGKPYTADAAYCFNVPGYCDPTTYNNTVQWTVFQNGTYVGFGGFPSSTAYNPQHKYTQNIQFAFDATLRLSLTDSAPDDNTGSLTVGLWKLPLDVFRFYAVGCRSKTRFTRLVLSNGGCQSARLVAEGPATPEGAGIDVQVREGKRWRGLPVRCTAGLPPERCVIYVNGHRPETERYRAVLRNPANGGAIIARRNVTIEFLA